VAIQTGTHESSLLLKPSCFFQWIRRNTWFSRTVQETAVEVNNLSPSLLPYKSLEASIFEPLSLHLIIESESLASIDIRSIDDLRWVQAILCDLILLRLVIKIFPLLVFHFFI
jgi:hypothetical protein